MFVYKQATLFVECSLRLISKINKSALEREELVTETLLLIGVVGSVCVYVYGLMGSGTYNLCERVGQLVLLAATTGSQLQTVSQTVFICVITVVITLNKYVYARAHVSVVSHGAVLTSI